MCQKEQLSSQCNSCSERYMLLCHMFAPNAIPFISGSNKPFVCTKNLYCKQSQIILFGVVGYFHNT